jgi:hypothetical protein
VSERRLQKGWLFPRRQIPCCPEAIAIDQTLDRYVEREQRVKFRVVKLKLIVILTSTTPVAGEDREAFKLHFGNGLTGSNQSGDILGIQRGIGVCSACRVNSLAESMV